MKVSPSPDARSLKRFVTVKLESVSVKLFSETRDKNRPHSECAVFVAYNSCFLVRSCVGTLNVGEVEKLHSTQVRGLCFGLRLRDRAQVELGNTRPQSRCQNGKSCAENHLLTLDFLHRYNKAHMQPAELCMECQTAECC